MNLYFTGYRDCSITVFGEWDYIVIEDCHNCRFTMYAFQEVHTYNDQPCGSSSSRFDIIHEETGLRTRYYGKTPPPEFHCYPSVFNAFFMMDTKDRILTHINGKKLPAMKENYPTPISPPVAWPTAGTSPFYLGKLIDVNLDDYVKPDPYNDFYDFISYVAPQRLETIKKQFKFGNCKPAMTPAPTEHYVSGHWTTEKQGNNPMRYDDMYATKTNTNVAGSSTVINMTNQSDESKQREYLLAEFAEATNWRDPVSSKMQKLFNLNAPTKPHTSAEILAAFKDGKFTVDQKKVDANAKYFKALSEDDDNYEDRYDDEGEYVGGQYYGITFTDLPVADRKGYEAAMAEYETLKKNVKRTIIVGTPAEGLAALLSLEAFAPTTVTLH